MTISAEALEQRRIWTLRGAVAGLLIPAIGWPLAMRFGEGSETAETIGGAVLLAGLIALIAVPVVLGLWRRHMARTLLDALVAGRSDLRHIDGATRQNEAATALGSPACELGQFGPAGLTEPFGSASIDHVLAGTSEGIPFVLAELRLYNEEGFEVFAGVVGGFQLQRACPGLTLVARDRGLLGNLIASAGTGIERVGVEDPNFERRFEAYGTDQVWSRTVLTTDHDRAPDAARRPGPSARLPLCLRRRAAAPGPSGPALARALCGGWCFHSRLGSRATGTGSAS